KYLIAQRPFTTHEVEKKAAEVLISIKAGKRVAIVGKRKIRKDGKTKVVQEGIVVPRGALSEDSVYGKIRLIERNMPLKYLFENPEHIVKGYIKKQVKERLDLFGGDPKKALNSLKDDPILLKGDPQ